MTIDTEIRTLLRSDKVKEINFIVEDRRVTGQGFWELSNCFSDTTIRHRIRVTVNPAIVGHHASAIFEPNEDKLNLRSSNELATMDGRSGVVHECTHAQFDLRGIDTRIRSEEGAAFIAESWYLLACGLSVAAIQASHPIIPSDIVALTSEIRNSARGGTPVSLSDAQLARLRNAVAGILRANGRPYYRTGYYDSNGIRGRIYRGP